MTSTTSTAAPRPVLPGRGRRLLLPAVYAVGTAAFLGVAHVVDPNVPGQYPTCPWLLLTGTWCPGCGTLRASHALTEGDLATAFARNPFTVLALAAMAVGWVAYARRQWRGVPRTRAAPAWLLWALFWAILAFWVLRNVPGWTWLSPA